MIKSTIFLTSHKESSRVVDEFRREKAESVDVLIDLNSYDESEAKNF